MNFHVMAAILLCAFVIIEFSLQEFTLKLNEKIIREIPLS